MKRKKERKEGRKKERKREMLETEVKKTRSFDVKLSRISPAWGGGGGLPRHFSPFGILHQSQSH